MSLFRFSIAAVGALCLCAATLAAQDDSEGNSQNLGQINVTGNVESDPLTKKVGETKKSAKTLEKQQVSDTRDLVKYETGVSVVESGRMGSSGYSIRGVDENRVAITIDGLHQAETLSSQGFKEIFEGYGNFNNTRNGVEMENVKQATITKGADSIKAGSGALGGSVMFETKDARDYLIDKNWFYGFKAGISSRDKEKMRSHTLAAKVNWFDFLVIRTDRNSHELRNYGYGTYDDSVRGREREQTDPYTIKKESTLVKISFQPNDENRITLMNDDSKNRSKGNDYSYTLYPRSITNPDFFESKLGERYTDDLSKRENRGIAYENFTETPLWDSVKFSFSNQRIKQRARTEEYCRGDNCAEIANPIIKRDGNNNIVDSNGNEFNIDRGGPGGMTRLIDSNGKTYLSGYAIPNISNMKLNCEEFNCNGPLTLYRIPFNSDPIEKMSLPLNSPTYNFTGSNGKNYEFDIHEETLNGKRYKVIKPSYTNGIVKQDSNEFNMLLPNSQGYLERDWKERDLNTDTKQFDLDFSKDFNLLSVENSLSYGLKYIKTDKSMVNRAGFDATNPQWWADTAPGDCQGADAFNALKCPKTEPETSFLIPVESKNGVFHVADDVIVNDFFDFNLAYRYDRVRYKPGYVPGKTPKIPDGMVEGLFIPLAKNPLPEPKWSDYPNWSDYVAARNAYLAKQAEVDALNATNAERNIEYMSKPKEYKNNSYAVGLNFNPLEFVRIQTKYSKAFRAPTTDELYLAFKHPDFTIKPNVDLRPEIAKTKEVAVTFHSESQSFITLSRFKTDYQDFLDLEYQGTKRVNTNANSALDFDMYQNVNRQRAKVNGIEISSKFNLSDISDSLGGFYVGYKFTKQKGKILTDDDGLVPMNAIQPKTSVYNVGYAEKNDKFGVDIYLTTVSAKKPEDTYNMFWKNERQSGDPINGRQVTDYRAHWLSTSYKVLDLVAYTKPTKNLTFRFGCYNITDEKYLTWESARSVRSFGTTNMVRKSDSLGINRFYAPGRNFKLTFELTL
ncbi:TonB-dependent receptor [uncultured Campylobacter sp.]|uniref:TonB-dependent receptor domain-containing protein n=1 Tax=uncultured Campylobacter sp. TaxID=218934 RepID=UPI002617B690|nr:TonB-dependent receptor [uncultured Campylobacter sp.]